MNWWRYPAVLIIILLLSTPAIGADTVISIVYNTNANPPRILGDGTSIDWEKPGISLELLKMVEEKVGVTFQFRRVPWKRGLLMIETGKADATFHASYKTDRAAYSDYPQKDGELDPSRRIFDSNYALYVKKDSYVRYDGQLITNALRPIGAQLDFAIADDLRAMGYTIEEEASVQSNLNKLLGGRISAYAEIETLADTVIQSDPSRYCGVIKLDPLLREKGYYLIFSKHFTGKSPELAERIWDAIRDVQLTDEYAAMVKRYEE